MKYVITGRNFISPVLTEYAKQEGHTLLTEQGLKNSDIGFTGNDILYVPDESSFPVVASKIVDKKLKEQLETVKNKYTCRLFLRDLYPKFYFKDIVIDELASFKLPDKRKYIVKVQKGFFGFGIREIDYRSNLKEIAENLKRTVREGSQFFSEDVFTKDRFIIEEYIEGEEYTFDAFYDSKGHPILVNFCHHPVPNIKKYEHLLYYTNEEIYRRFSAQVLDIFRALNSKLKIKNIAVHAEFKERDGKLIPIEFNVPRFGGFGLADLPYYAFGVNAFKHFFEGTSPDWESILAKHKNKSYGWVLCYNGIGVDLEKQKPDYEKIRKDLGKVLNFYKLDYKKNPAFGIGYVEKNNKQELDALLAIDFRDYFSKN